LAQKRYADYYNSKSSNKQFDVGEQVIYLARNSDRKMFSHWLGPCLILRNISSHSYVIDVDGVHRTVLVNHLRKFHPSISEVNVNNCALIFDTDEDFGRILSVDIDSCDTEVDNIDDFPLLLLIASHRMMRMLCLT